MKLMVSPGATPSSLFFTANCSTILLPSPVVKERAGRFRQPLQLFHRCSSDYIFDSSSGRLYRPSSPIRVASRVVSTAPSVQVPSVFPVVHFGGVHRYSVVFTDLSPGQAARDRRIGIAWKRISFARCYHVFRVGLVISASLCMSPCRPDYIFTRVGCSVHSL